MEIFINILIAITILLAGVLIGAMVQSSINYDQCLNYHDNIVYTEAKRLCDVILN
jgi:hypothetical protein